MKAAIYHGPRDIRVEEVDVPDVPLGHVLVETKATGICGSDIHIYRGDFRQPRFACGHELSGVVVEVGEDVSGFDVGDRVCAECFSHCGRCFYCETGRYNLCDNLEYLYDTRHAGLSEYSLLHASSLFKLPDELSFEEGAMVEPLAVSYRALARAGVTPNNRIAILGAGTIGLLCLALAKSFSVREIFITAKYAHQAVMAERYGAHHVIRIGEEDVKEKVASVTGGVGVDAVIDTVGSDQTFKDSLEIVRKGGILCLVAMYPRPLQIHLQPIVIKELGIVGSNCYAYNGLEKDFDASIHLIASGRVDVTSLITHRFPLEEVAEAFRIAADKRKGSIKVLIDQQ